MYPRAPQMSPNPASEMMMKSRLSVLGLTMALAGTPSLSCAATRPENESGQFLDGQFSIGGGSTYQYDGSKGTSLALVTWTWADDRYELAAIRFLSRQVKRDAVLENPDWVFHAERRWSLLHNSAGRLFLGGGAAYKNETDDINGSRLNFTEELLWRFPWRPAAGEFELAIRHMSNAGLKKPNKGQDFITVVYGF
jgi:Lipid A 3-O-deacylase (PagL)